MFFKKMIVISFLALCLILGFKDTKAATITGEYATVSKLRNTYVMKIHPDGGTKYHLMSYISRIGPGNHAYCLDPWESLGIDLYTGTNENQHIVGGMSRENWEKISLMSHYGYGYPGHDHLAWYIATQLLIWETLEPNATFYTTDGLNGPILEVKEKDELKKLVEDHLTLPSFDKKKITLTFGEKNIIKDNNEVLKDYLIEHSDELTITKDGNNLVVTPNTIGTFTVSYEREIPYNITYEPYIYYKEGFQSVLEKGRAKDMSGYVTFEVKSPTVQDEQYKGKITLNKKGEKFIAETFEYENVPFQGIKFILKAKEDIYINDGKNLLYKKDQVIESLITDSNGEAFSMELPLGNYYITEETPLDNYVKSDDYEISLTTHNLNPKIDIINYLKKGEVSIIKMDAETKKPLVNVYFEIYDEKMEKVYQGITNEEGKITIKLPYGIYYYKEIKTNDGYALNDNIKEFIVDSDNKTIDIYNYKIEIPKTNDTLNEKLRLGLSFVFIGGILLLGIKKYNESN